MFLEIAQYFSSFVIAVAGFLGAIVGIQKFIDTYTAKGKARVAARKEAKKKQLQEISKETAKTLMGEFEAHQEEVTGEILSRLDEISERVDDIEQVNHSQNEMFQLLNKKVDKNEIDRIRNEIFSFASQCRHRQEVPTADNFHHIFVIHDKYMELLKTNNLTNGQMDVDFTYIKDYYNKLSEEGKI